MATQAQCYRTITILSAVLAFSVAVNVHSREDQAVVHNQRPIIVEVHRTQGRLTFKLEPDPAPGKDILWGLAALVEQRGRDYPVVALVDDNAKIIDMDQVPGIAGKAGFNNTRTFVLKRDTGMMAEIRFCAAVPISKTPPAESACNLAK